jgi:hypothetical protein
LEARPGLQVVVTVSDSTLLAINAARTIQFRSSRRQAGRFCAAIASVPVAHNLAPDADLKV